jgi:hypothetical protein
MARALRVLEEIYPSEMAFSELCKAVGGEPKRLAPTLLQLAIADLLELRSHQRGIPKHTGALLPKAFRLAAIEAIHSEIIPNLLHDNVKLTPRQRTILALCNGLNSREAILSQSGNTMSIQELEAELSHLRRLALLCE